MARLLAVVAVGAFGRAVFSVIRRAVSWVSRGGEIIVGFVSIVKAIVVLPYTETVYEALANV